MPEKVEVYVPLSDDVLHPGHLNVLDKAAALGSVTVGLLTDQAVAQYRRIPQLSYEERLRIACALRQVDQVVPQSTWSYKENLETYRPHYVVHGDDWRNGIQWKVRQEVIDVLAQWDGQLVEVPYMGDASSAQTGFRETRTFHNSTDLRRGQLRRLLAAKSPVRLMEAHNALSAAIVERAQVEEEGRFREFDGLWASSLTESVTKMRPDTESVDVSDRINLLNQMLEVTTKPFIFDADTGGRVEHFEFTLKTLERLGVSAAIVEDKTGLKRNSLYGTAVRQEQLDPLEFGEKLRAGRDFVFSEDFMLIARIESLIAGEGIESALNRAMIYLEAGADGIMIHSSKSDTTEIEQFARSYATFSAGQPLVVVPTAFSHMAEDDLAEWGVDLVIYANHLIRAAYPAMLAAADRILRDGKAEFLETSLAPVSDILNLVDG